MSRHSLASLEKRLEALERVIKEPPEIWIAPHGMEIGGWEVTPGNGYTESIMRQEGESDDDLKQRARKSMFRLRKQNPMPSVGAVYFAIKPSGVGL